MTLRKSLLAAVATLPFVQSVHAQSETENVGTLFFDCISETEDGDFRARFESTTRLLNDEGELADLPATVIEGHSDIIGPYSYETAFSELNTLLQRHTNYMATLDKTATGYPTFVSDNNELQKAKNALIESELAQDALPSCEEEAPYLGA